jgi:hypothetical protein
MGVGAHDVTTTFLGSSTAATAATCRTGGRTCTRHAGKRRRREQRRMKNMCALLRAYFMLHPEGGNAHL